MVSDVCVTEKAEKWQMRWENQNSPRSFELRSKLWREFASVWVGIWHLRRSRLSNSWSKNTSLHATESSREWCDRKSQIVYIRWGWIQRISSLLEGKVQGAVWTQEHTGSQGGIRNQVRHFNHISWIYDIKQMHVIWVIKKKNLSEIKSTFVFQLTCA